MYLTPSMTLNETLGVLPQAEKERRSRFTFRSPCYFVKSMDILVHVAIPELIEDTFPTVTRYLRSTSPRWGRSWRDW